jgi:hypothetical protein
VRAPAAHPCAFASGPPSPHDHADGAPRRFAAILPDHALLATPTRHPLVARIGPAWAGFFVAEKMGETHLAANALEHLGHIAHAHQQPEPKGCERRPQRGHAIRRKLHMLRIALRAVDPLRFNHEKRQRRIALRGGVQRGVILHTQVAFEPNSARVDMIR